MARSAWVPVLVVATAVSCAASFQSQSQITALRVLAVQKDKPYARPGDTVTLRMLLADGSDQAPRPVHVVWFAGCTNPVGDVYTGCFAALALGPKTGAGAAPALPAGIALPDEGPEFSYALPRNIISSHAASSDPKQVPYGVSFVFFAACAGDHLGLVAPSGDAPSFPFACYSKSGQILGADDFVVGYTEVFAYDALTNNNPAVTGFQVDGNPVVPECIGAACISLEEAELNQGRTVILDAGTLDSKGNDGGRSADAGTLDSGGIDGGRSADAGSGAPGTPAGAGQSVSCSAGDARCIPVCTQASQDDCPKHKIKMILDQTASVEEDTSLEAREGGHIEEQMWINYYADGGKIPIDVKLLNDTTIGWNEAHDTEILAPLVPGPFHVWAVAHDNRGGTQWVQVKLVAH